MIAEVGRISVLWEQAPNKRANPKRSALHTYRHHSMTQAGCSNTQMNSNIKTMIKKLEAVNRRSASDPGKFISEKERESI